MNAQEIFDKVKTHLETLEGRASDDNGCMYLMDDGRRCAIGVLLPDGPWLKHNGDVDDLLAAYPKLSDKILPTDLSREWSYVEDEDGVEVPRTQALNFLDRLQTTHDARQSWGANGRFGSHGRTALKAIARDFELVYANPAAS